MAGRGQGPHYDGFERLPLRDVRNTDPAQAGLILRQCCGLMVLLQAKAGKYREAPERSRDPANGTGTVCLYFVSFRRSTEGESFLLPPGKRRESLALVGLEDEQKEPGNQPGTDHGKYRHPGP